MLENFEYAFEIMFEVFTILGPIGIYAPQYMMMNRTKSPGSFSKLICYILLVANMLRIIFWLAH
jgi:hypothetical protein